ncbi:rhodanese-like domain-containing protein [Corynebacterium yudongzhengii]|uniref:rhodanese-like domain-containing protein n=1 Tax=Corynebacterium yudongzhengii TaxID=2080740 RepID=UPI0018EE9438|nr:rhodanese-like domain-containing protein [Corynebacterium yudongzhengii]
MTHLVDSRWLNDNLDNVVVIDTTTAFDPSEPSNQVQARNSRAAYEASHIPGAVHADLMDTLAKPDTQLHCIALDSGAFQEIARGLGVSEGSHVVVYDQGGNDVGHPPVVEPAPGRPRERQRAGRRPAGVESRGIPGRGGRCRGRAG